MYSVLASEQLDIIFVLINIYGWLSDSLSIKDYTEYSSITDLLYHLRTLTCRQLSVVRYYYPAKSIQVNIRPITHYCQQPVYVRSSNNTK